MPRYLAEGFASSVKTKDFERKRVDFQKALCQGNFALQKGQGVLEQFVDNDCHNASTKLFPAVVHWSRARRMGATLGGRFANVPMGAEPGDIVCTLLGGSVPYILRPRPDGYYNLIGEFYVHGLMHGEAGIPGRDDNNDLPTRQFAIR